MRTILFLIILSSTVVHGDTISFQKGWNFIGFNNDIQFSKDSSFSDEKKVNIIWKYTNKNWNVYTHNVTLKEKVEDLNITFSDTLLSYEGAWVNVLKDFTYSVEPKKHNLSNTDIYLVDGWNLLSSVENTGIDLNKDIFKSATMIWTYRDNKWFLRVPKNLTIVNNFKDIQFLDEIKPYEAFWIKKDKTTTTRADAIKFLKQASLSIKESAITYVMNNGYEAWIDDQFTKQFNNNSSLLYNLYDTLGSVDSKYNTSMMKPTAANCEKEATVDKYRILSKALWWGRAFDDEDQLRQKVAYALSQIIVVGAKSPAGNLLSWRGEALAYYYDILQKNAFGNYKNLLRDITYSPAMAYYMTYIGSAKYDTAKGTSPDENYARELMQLFSIGISQLNTDGSKVLENGNEKPTYTQEDVINNAKLMTGWDLVNSPKFGRISKRSGCYILPIVFSNEHHDITAKTILGTSIPAGQTGKQDIESLLTIMINNKNIAPYISKRLIQRLTTSNPSPAYIKRVVDVFNDNGSGVKGDLQVVVKTILLDEEARKNTNTNSGKVDELLTSATHLLSTFGVKPTHSWKIKGSTQVPTDKPLYWISAESLFAQSVFGAPDVFNFYDANYVPNDVQFSKNNLVAPELQIQTSRNLIKYSNFLDAIFQNDRYFRIKIDTGKGHASMQEYMTDALAKKSASSTILVYVDLTDVYDAFKKALGDDFSNIKNDATKRDTGIVALINYLDNKMLGGTLPGDYKEKLKESLSTLYNFSGKSDKTAREIVVNAIKAIATSSYYMTIR